MRLCYNVLKLCYMRIINFLHDDDDNDDINAVHCHIYLFFFHIYSHFICGTLSYFLTHTVMLCLVSLRPFQYHPCGSCLSLPFYWLFLFQSINKITYSGQLQALLLPCRCGYWYCETLTRRYVLTSTLLQL